MAMKNYPELTPGQRHKELVDYFIDVELRGEKELAEEYERLKPGFDWINRHFDVAYIVSGNLPMLVRVAGENRPRRSMLEGITKAEAGKAGWRRYSEVRDIILAHWRTAPPMEPGEALRPFLAQLFHRYAWHMDNAAFLASRAARRRERAEATNG